MSITSSIFSGSIPEIDNRIITFADSCSLVSLSGVNNRAYIVLSNQFFKERFYKENAHFQGCKNIYITIQNFYPDYCWKVVIYFSSSLCAKQNNDLAPCAFKEAIPAIRVTLSSRKSQCEIELKAICGSYYQDPSSPIHQAWVAFTEAEQEEKDHPHLIEEKHQAYLAAKKEFEDWRTKTNELIVTLLQDIHPEESQVVVLQAITNYKELILNEESSVEFADVPDDELLPLIKCHLPCYRVIANCLIETETKETNMFTLRDEYLAAREKTRELKSKYLTLEISRRQCENKILGIELDLDLLNIEFNPYALWQRPASMESVFNEMFYQPMCSELRKVRDAEEIAGSIKPLKNCCSLIQKVINKEEEATPAVLQSIADLINSCSKYDTAYSTNLQQRIWRNLFYASANGNPEVNWAENHFSEFLPQLNLVIEKIISLRQSCLDSLK